MSRHRYVDDFDDDLAAGRWRGAVRSAMRGKRGQAFLREMLAALDAMPNKRLTRAELIAEDGEVCAMGCVLAQRRVDASAIDPEDYERVASVTGLAEAMVREIAYENDDGAWIVSKETPEDRWTRMRAWTAKQIIATAQESERG